MKKVYYFAWAVLMMAALAGCRTTEKEYATYTAKKGEVVFRLAQSNTRSSEAITTVQGVTIPVGDDGMGNQLFLEETITRLDGIYEEPATKGTPAYTENFVDLYGDFKAAAFRTSGSSFESSPFDDGVFERVGTGLWKRNYADEVQDQFPLYFFLRAPYDLEETAVTNLKYNTSNGSITFDYDGSSLTSASAQKDLLFTSRLVDEDEYDKFVKKTSATPSGIPVLFHHALTGIKFANFFDNPDLDTKTYITKVEITGLKNGGTCVITPRQETDGYVDDKGGDFSSADVTVWTLSDEGTDVVFTQSFDETGKDEIDFAEEGNFGDKGSYTGTTFGKAGNLNNLNKADGSLTFWFVPQQLTEDVQMTVYYKVINTKYENKTHEDHDTIAFGDLTRKQTKNADTGAITYGAYANWRAGELRTYTLKPKYVEVELVDHMTDDKFTKENVKVTNNGNVYEYVRINLIGNWVGKVQTDEDVFTDEETILFGYAAETGDARVEAWNDKDGKTHYGEFKDLVPKSEVIPAAESSIVNNWVRYDKYYYYINAIGPNESITDQLFTYYTVGVSPEFWIPDRWGVRRKAGDVHLIMDVIVQAIPAETNAAGEITDDYISAWVRELGKNSPQDLLDL